MSAPSRRIINREPSNASLNVANLLSVLQISLYHTVIICCFFGRPRRHTSIFFVFFSFVFRGLCLKRIFLICSLTVPTGQWTYNTGVQNVQYSMSTFDTSFFNASEYCHQIGGRLAQLKTSIIHVSCVLSDWIKHTRPQILVCMQGLYMITSD